MKKGRKEKKQYSKPRVRSQSTLERQILGSGGCTWQGNAGPVPPGCTKNLA